MEVKCDECSKHFSLKLKEKKHPKGIIETYFKCPECKKKYIAFVTNQDVRKQQNKLRKLRSDLNGMTDIKQYNDLLKEIERIQQTLTTTMNKLKEQIFRCASDE